MDITSLTAPAVNATTATWTQSGMVDRFWAGVLCLSFFEGSFASEIIRAGLQAISSELNDAPVQLQLGTLSDNSRKSAKEN